MNTATANRSIRISALVWGAVTLLMVFLPLQPVMKKNMGLPEAFQWLDEIFVVLSLCLFVLIILSKGKMKKDLALMCVPMGCFAVAGLLSGILNGNPMIVTLNGIFDYIKYFMVIPVFMTLQVSMKRFTRLYTVLRRLAVLVSLVAILQTCLVLLGLSVLGYVETRLGLPRVRSIVGHPNNLGLYSLLFFVLDYSMNGRITKVNAILACGIIFSVSRMIWFAALVALVLNNMKKNLRGLVVILFVAAAVLSVMPFMFSKSSREMNSTRNYRGYALEKSMEIWHDYPILGVGPGMYGGVVSVIFDSPVYSEYNFSPFWYKYGLLGFRSIDQFWPQSLAETGAAGTLCFVSLLAMLYYFGRKKTGKDDTFRSKSLYGFSVLTLTLAIYLFGTGLNMTLFLLTYCVLFGMLLGAKDENTDNQ